MHRPFCSTGLSISLFKEPYYRWGRARGGLRPVHFDPFFFPLDRIEAWNRLYGRRGFVQYQCVLPKAKSPTGIAALLERDAFNAVRAEAAGEAPRFASTLSRRLAL